MLILCSRTHLEKEVNHCDEVPEVFDLVATGLQEGKDQDNEDVEATSDENDSESSDEEGGMGYMFEVQHQQESTENIPDDIKSPVDQLLSIPRKEALQDESLYASQFPPSNEELSSFCQEDEISDEALLRLLESYETTSGGLTHHSSSNTPGQREESHHPHTPAAPSPAPYPSPYLQPFTPSKKSTPGKYLYLPTLDLSSRPLCIPEAFPEITNLKPNTFVWRHLSDKANCSEFLTKLRRCKCISFELVFDSIPLSPGHGGVPHAIVNRAWAPMISWRRSMQQGSKSGTRGSGPQPSDQLLVGIAICFGDEVGYYLPLPKIPPLLSLPIKKNDDKKPATLQHLPNSTPTLCSLPESALILICRFVGFGKILHKCLGLYPSDYSQEESFISSLRGGGYVHETNPLLIVSKKWAELGRRCLRYEWMRGQCLEWRLLGKIMNSSSITKVSTEMKDKLICLRERDILVNGFIEDPTVARSLLEIDETTTAPALQPPHRHPSLTTTTSSLHSNHMNNMSSNIKEACFKAIHIFRTMGELENSLKSHHLWSTFLNIEMPLCYTVADAELNGIPINTIFWTDLRQDLNDRVKMIEYFFRETQGMNFSLSNPRDISKLKLQLGPAGAAGGGTGGGTTGIGSGSGSQSVALCLMDGEGDDNDNDNDVIIQNTSDAESTTEATTHVPLVLQLVQEWRSHTRILPLCNLILQNRCHPYGTGGSNSCSNDSIDRTRGKYHSIGTETGRLIITSPPLQQVPHSCTYLPSLRESLHKELQRSPRQSMPDLIQFLNKKAVTGEAEWVRVTKMKQNLSVSSSEHDPYNHLYSDNGMMSSSSSPATSCATTTGKLVAITSTPINKFVIQTSRNSSTPTLLDMWRGAGFPYQEEDGKNILGVMVNINNKIFSYPADQVFRLQAPIVPHHTEVTQVKLSLTQQQQRQQQHHTSSNLFSSLTQSTSAVIPPTYGSTPTPIPTTLPVPVPPKITLNPRDGFRASPGNVFIASDYSQIELRIFAHFAMDPHLSDAFIRHEEEDIFLSIASQWKSKPIKNISKEERNLVKQLCYALLYGAGSQTVAKNASCTIQEAEFMIRNFLECYSGIQKFIQEVKKRCRVHGFVETMLGRKRHLPKIRSADRKDRARAERQAVNTVCQGSAADLIKVNSLSFSPSSFSHATTTITVT
jgi:DNA polymerase I-like protein with 3'-5' exonuclease and polymerase domains